MSNSFIAINNLKIDIITEVETGKTKSDGAAMPEMKSIFCVVKRNGLNLASGSTIPSSDMTAVIPPVKSRGGFFMEYSVTAKQILETPAGDPLC